MYRLYIKWIIKTFVHNKLVKLLLYDYKVFSPKLYRHSRVRFPWSILHGWQIINNYTDSYKIHLKRYYRKV